MAAGLARRQRTEESPIIFGHDEIAERRARKRCRACGLDHASATLLLSIARGRLN